jgi:hypothetical protein
VFGILAEAVSDFLLRELHRRRFRPSPQVFHNYRIRDTCVFDRVVKKFRSVAFPPTRSGLAFYACVILLVKSCMCLCVLESVELLSLRQHSKAAVCRSNFLWSQSSANFMFDRFPVRIQAPVRQLLSGFEAQLSGIVCKSSSSYSCGPYCHGLVW